MIHSISGRKARHLGGSALVLALLLSGCGGGGSDASSSDASTTATTASVPNSAFASTQAFMAFELSLKPSDGTEPLQVGTQTAPTDDRAEPMAFAM